MKALALLFVTFFAASAGAGNWVDAGVMIVDYPNMATRLFSDCPSVLDQEPSTGEISVFEADCVYDYFFPAIGEPYTNPDAVDYPSITVNGVTWVNCRLIGRLFFRSPDSPWTEYSWMFECGSPHKENRNADKTNN